VMVVKLRGVLWRLRRDCEGLQLPDDFSTPTIEFRKEQPLLNAELKPVLEAYGATSSLIRRNHVRCRAEQLQI
jgi:hypothetical protein